MKNPCASIKKIKQEIKPRESLTQMDMEIIRANLVNSRERMLIEVLFSTGCRVSEFAGIKLTDIKWAGKETVVQVLGKGKKYRDCPLTARAQIAIKKYFAECGFTSEWLYPSTYDGHKKLTYATVEKDVAKINARVEGMISHKLHPHIIRHTTATIALQNGMPVEYVKELLGHSRLDTTMIYAETDMSQLQQYHNRCVG